ncbi:hypothetical protein CEP51_016275, partial [Fusarium floridanum]
TPALCFVSVAAAPAEVFSDACVGSVGSFVAAGFKLQAPPTKAPSATPKMSQGGFTPAPMPAPAPPATPTVHVSEHGPAATNEPTYEAVPIPGAYSGQVYGDQALRSPPPTQTTFGHAQ